jgi:hypothetical protein
VLDHVQLLFRWTSNSLQALSCAAELLTKPFLDRTSARFPREFDAEDDADDTAHQRSRQPRILAFVEDPLQAPPHHTAEYQSRTATEHARHHLTATTVLSLRLDCGCANQ